jgi:hypothetical protein
MNKVTKADTTRVNLFIAPALWKALRVRAIEQGTTATALLNHLIAEYLKRPAPLGKEKR